MVIRKYFPSDCVHLAKWNQSFSEHYTAVALMDDVIAGFEDIDQSGYLDRLYVRKGYQRQGAASAICDELEKAVDADTITTHASITARPFFEQRGYEVMKEQQVIRSGIPLTNYVMKKNGKGKPERLTEDR